MTPEGKVKAKIKSLLKLHDAYYFMPVQNGMGSPALDFYVCHKGRFIGIEAKAPGKYATPRQVNTMDEIVSAGGATIVVSDDNSMAMLNDLLNGDL